MTDLGIGVPFSDSPSREPVSIVLRPMSRSIRSWIGNSISSANRAFRGTHPSITAPTFESGRSLNRLARWLALAQLVLVASTWKLWTPQTVFPQVPLLQIACNWPAWIDWICLATLIGSSLALFIVGRSGLLHRWACAGCAVSWTLFFVLDQHRLQPWAWQFFLLALLLLTTTNDTMVRRAWIWLTVSIYFWSAIWKLDLQFFVTQGPFLVEGLKQAIGLRGLPNAWSRTFDVAGSVGLALGELSVALLLAWPRTRRFGLWLATAMHLALLAALGPFGLRHSAGVLLWNLFFIGQDWMLFRPASRDVVRNPGDAQQPVPFPGTWHGRAALALVAFAIGWPALHPFGLCDHWLAWAVYSSHTDRVYLVQRHKQTGTWEEVDIARRSLDELGAPIYPQSRFYVGIALQLASDMEPADSELAIQFPQKSNWNVAPLISAPDQLKTIAARYRFNAHPRRLAGAVQTRQSPEEIGPERRDH